jgi:hypothetical protein
MALGFSAEYYIRLVHQCDEKIYIDEYLDDSNKNELLKSLFPFRTVTLVGSQSLCAYMVDHDTSNIMFVEISDGSC